MSGLDTTGWDKEDWLIQRYKYIPSEAAAIAFAAIFGLTTLIHLLQLVRSKTWYFVPFLIGGIFETGGYTIRAIDVKMAEKITFIVQTILILLAPALFAASIYMSLKRVIMLLDAAPYSLINVRWLTRFFVGCDVVSFLTQGAGGGILASHSNDKGTSEEKNKNTGNYLVIAGLAIQLIAFAFFIVVTAVFHRRIQRRPTEKSLAAPVLYVRYLFVLYFASSIIMARSIFRLIEYIQGRDGYLMSHEVYAYVFDAALMLMVSVAFNVLHPSRIISVKATHKAMGNNLDGSF